MHGMKFIEKYFFLGLIIASAFFVLIIMFPFLTTIIMGLALSIVLRPLYEGIRKRTPYKSNTLAAFATVLIFLIVLCGPLLLLGSVVFNQFQNLYSSLNGVDSEALLTNLSNSINGLLPTGFGFNVQQEIANFIGSLSANVQGFFTATLTTIFSVLLTILALFYFLKDGHNWRKIFIEVSPLATEHSQKLFSTIARGVNAIVKGYLLIGVAQGLLMGIGLAIFGVPHAALWGVVAGVASLVPMIGTAFVSIPAIAYLLLTGSTTGAIGLSIWAVVLVGTIDNLLSPLIVGRQTDLPPLIVLFSVLGGLSLMGPVGILIGPLSASVFRALVVIYREDIKE
jgi:predicted PurR-regulated permease PerM